MPAPRTWRPLPLSSTRPMPTRFRGRPVVPTSSSSLQQSVVLGVRSNQKAPEAQRSDPLCDDQRDVRQLAGNSCLPVASRPPGRRPTKAVPPVADAHGRPEVSTELTRALANEGALLADVAAGVPSAGLETLTGAGGMGVFARKAGPGESRGLRLPLVCLQSERPRHPPCARATPSSQTTPTRPRSLH